MHIAQTPHTPDLAGESNNTWAHQASISSDTRTRLLYVRAEIKKAGKSSLSETSAPYGTYIAEE